MSPEERDEYDALMYEAGRDTSGKPYPSGEIGPRVHTLLTDAEQAGRQWATWVIEDDTITGHLARYKGWSRKREVVQTPVGDRVVRRSAVMSLRRKDSETGERLWQPTFYLDMSRDDLLAVIADARMRINSERITISTGTALVALLDETSMETVGDALTLKGLTLEEWLAEVSERAAS